MQVLKKFYLWCLTLAAMICLIIVQLVVVAGVEDETREKNKRLVQPKKGLEKIETNTLPTQLDVKKIRATYQTLLQGGGDVARKLYKITRGLNVGLPGLGDANDKRIIHPKLKKPIEWELFSSQLVKLYAAAEADMRKGLRRVMVPRYLKMIAARMASARLCASARARIVRSLR